MDLLGIPRCLPLIQSSSISCSSDGAGHGRLLLVLMSSYFTDVSGVELLGRGKAVRSFSLHLSVDSS